MKKVIFDICDTLYAQNTTFEFIHFLETKGVIKHSSLFRFYPTKFILIVLYKFFRWDLYRELMILRLKGIPIEMLRSCAEDYYNEVLAEKKIDRTHELLEKFQASTNCEVVLCSASIDVVVSEIAKKLNITNFFSTSLSYSNGVCEGKIERDILGKKSTLFSDKLYWVVTDNKSDLDLIKFSENYTVISRKKDLLFWQRQSVNVSIIR
ncbi:HAD family hydrolase [Pragia fontium]|uniref:HAD family hydrolase n=1 Tax=Pragia fontium TaxID=82985 RepID=UPI00064B44E3|nr:haloacid dehalogenase-like hydrolase [Pragia fontium]AKJ42873.1 hypothetical protein QQ39_13020 [Pragia fontium]